MSYRIGDKVLELAKDEDVQLDVLMAIPVVLVIAAFGLAFNAAWLWAFFLLGVAVWIEVGL